MQSRAGHTVHHCQYIWLMATSIFGWFPLSHCSSCNSTKFISLCLHQYFECLECFLQSRSQSITWRSSKASRKVSCMEAWETWTKRVTILFYPFFLLKFSFHQSSSRLLWITVQSFFMNLPLLLTFYANFLGISQLTQTWRKSSESFMIGVKLHVWDLQLHQHHSVELVKRPAQGIWKLITQQLHGFLLPLSQFSGNKVCFHNETQAHCWLWLLVHRIWWKCTHYTTSSSNCSSSSSGNLCNPSTCPIWWSTFQRSSHNFSSIITSGSEFYSYKPISSFGDTNTLPAPPILLYSESNAARSII